MIVRLPLLTLLVLAGCGQNAQLTEAAPATVALPGPEDARALLSGSWLMGLGEGGERANVLLDGPTGEGWIALYHGDLTAAEAAFGGVLARDPESNAARLGLARVHLARADEYDAAWRLLRDGSRALAAYRAAHRDRVRLGPYERALARILFAPAPPPEDEGGAAVVAGDPSILSSVSRLGPERAREASPEGLPQPWAATLAFTRAVEAVSLSAATTALDAVPWDRPDLVDPLGRDAATGLSFETPFFDPERLRALALFHALTARRLGGQLAAVGDTVIAEASRYGGAQPPQELLRWLPDPPGAGAEPPSLFATFGGPWLDPEDAQTPDPTAASSLSSRLVTRLPGWFATPAARGTIDRELQAIDALQQGAGEVLGSGLAVELGGPRLFADALLRRRMGALAAAQPNLAVRIGQRSVDPSPGALGGAASSRRTRVSYRNDRGFLLRLAAALWASGQPGAALDLVHPLAQEDRPLQPVADILGQLDAASSVGTAGKANQL